VLIFPLIPVDCEYASIKGIVKDRKTNEPIKNVLIIIYNRQVYFSTLTDCDDYLLDKPNTSKYISYSGDKRRLWSAV
jgi:hypothetical protein